MKEGIYAIYYTGITGSGQGLIVLKNGIISGADVVGGLYDGNYTEKGNKIEGMVCLAIPPATSLVTGASSGEEIMKFDIPLSLPSTFANGETISLKTPTGNINVIFRYLREI